MHARGLLSAHFTHPPLRCASPPGACAPFPAFPPPPSRPVCQVEAAILKLHTRRCCTLEFPPNRCVVCCAQMVWCVWCVRCVRNRRHAWKAMHEVAHTHR